MVIKPWIQIRIDQKMLHLDWICIGFNADSQSQTLNKRFSSKSSQTDPDLHWKSPVWLFIPRSAPYPVRNPTRSVPDPGCLSRIPDPNFFHPGSRVKKILDPGSGSASNNLNIFNSKNYFEALRIMIRVFIPDPDLDFLPIPDPGVKKAPDPGYATLPARL